MRPGRRPGPTRGEPAIGILHGYLLDGSGSNLWTQALVRTFCRHGVTVHLMCQEPHPEKFDFVARAVRYDETSRPTTTLLRDVPYPGRCILHKPRLGGVLPVYVGDRYEEHDRVVRMCDLEDDAIEDYIRRNAEALDTIVAGNGIAVLLANHSVLMPSVAQRVAGSRAIPFAVVPHGSAIEYVIRRDARFHRLAVEAFTRAGRLLVIGPEMRRRLRSRFSEVPGLDDKLSEIRLGVDTDLFAPRAPASRGDAIGHLKAMLRGTTGGRGPGTTATLRASLADSMSREELRRTLDEAADFDGKLPDADCARKLGGIDWSREKVLIYVGRLIAGKGVQGLVAAMPSILTQEPGVRLLLAGHGPLREALEVMLWALESGSRRLLNDIIARPPAPRGSRDAEPLVHVQRYLARLEQRGMLDEYLRAARKTRVSERVIFTGYLTHRELRYLLPCCDVALIPSLVAEAGPLVFLEALAAGVFPIGVYAAGLAASIDALGGMLPPAVLELMKLRGEPEHLVPDIVSHVPGALRLGRVHATRLRRAVVESHDLDTVGGTILDLLRDLARR